MNISYNWLKHYIDFDLSPAQTAEALTAIGLETDSVEEVETIKGGLRGLKVGRVTSCVPHPDSDHMHVCQVDLGEGETQQIVCGAPNVAEGQKVIVATIGTVLYDGDKEFVIKKSKLRGVESYGMICAEDEIGVGTSHDGIIVLPQDTPVGMEAAEYYGVESDYVIEVDITPNRADACSHFGVARDLKAYLLRRGGGQAQLRRDDVSSFSVDSHDLDIDIEVEQTEACPRYCAVTLRGCRVGESPEWLKKRLETIGLRPVNNVVDVTNYVMMAYGQPLHCFDVDMIKGRKVVVKTMPEGTPFVTLDGVEHKLSARDLAICNAEEPMCIAGVFGGKGSGTYETTTNVLLESAYFHPTWIRKSARRHGLATDASFRFERGIDPDGQIYALKLAAILVRELTGGKIAMDIKDVEAPGLTKAFDVRLDYAYARDLIGKDITADEIKAIVSSLEMTIKAEDAEGLSLSVPAYRVDVQRPCDVVEDILRIYGYNNIEIPSAVKSSLTIKGEADHADKLQNLIAEQLVGMGFREILNNSLTREAYYKDLKTLPAERLVRVLNPLSSDLGVMRQSLVFGGLETILHNVNRRQTNLRLFEVGNCYSYDADRRQADRPLAPYHEETRLGLWLTGHRVEGSWAHADEESSVHELGGYVAAILTRLGLKHGELQQAEGESDLFSHSLAVKDRSGQTLVEYGILRRALMPELSAEVYYADFAWSRLMKRVRKNTVSFHELPKYPAVSRDLALLVDKAVAFADIERISRTAGGKLLKMVKLFDVYEGKNLEPGKKSYAVNFMLQDEAKTMNDKQTEAVMKKITAALEKGLGARLR
ncbi:MAG: phenylalanine--tRNA ligase subunit beta [Alloprevotella sp.]